MTNQGREMQTLTLVCKIDYYVVLPSQIEKKLAYKNKII